MEAEKFTLKYATVFLGTQYCPAHPSGTGSLTAEMSMLPVPSTASTVPRDKAKEPGLYRDQLTTVLSHKCILHPLVAASGVCDKGAHVN